MIPRNPQRQDVILAAINYETAWNEYAVSDNPETRVTKARAHQRLLDTVRAYQELQPDIEITIQPAVETNEARTAE